MHHRRRQGSLTGSLFIAAGRQRQDARRGLERACVLATGGGGPSRSFHAVLRQLHDQLRVPFYVMADNDPAGYMLYFQIARGTPRREGNPRNANAIPEPRFLGLRARDYERLEMPACSTIPLKDEELEQLGHLESCPWLSSNAAWRREFGALRRHGFKVASPNVRPLIPPPPAPPRGSWLARRPRPGAAQVCGRRGA